MKIVYAIVCMLVFGVSSVFGVDWYVNANCSHNGDGTSHECASANGQSGAWAELVYIVYGSGGVQAGDTVYICSDTNTRSRVTVNGTAEHPIIIKPLFGVSPKMSVVDSFSSWTSLGDGRYTSPVYTGFLLEDSIYQAKASNTALNDGVWYYDGADTYYRPSSGTPNNHDVKRLMVRAVFDLQGHSHFHFSGLSFRNVVYGVHSDSTSGVSDIQVKNCYFYDIASAGIHLKARNTDNNDIVVERCVFNRVAQDVTIASHGDGPERSRNVSIKHNKFYNTFYTNNANYKWSEAGSLADGELVSVQNGDNVVIVENYADKSYKGIVCYCAPNSHYRGLKIKRNILNDVETYGIALQEANNGNHAESFVAYNVLQGNKGDWGFFLDHIHLTTTIVNNFISGYEYNVNLGHNIANIRFLNNLSYNPTGEHIAYRFTDSNDGNNDINYNLYYPDGSSKFESNYHIYHDFNGWKSATSHDVNSKTDDPLLTGYHISRQSPARNAGVKISDIHKPWPNWAKDIDGDSIVDTPDIGADEFRIRPDIGDSRMFIKEVDK